MESGGVNVCMSCRTIIRDPCRNCESCSVIVIIAGADEFLECQDCLFIE